MANLAFDLAPLAGSGLYLSAIHNIRTSWFVRQDPHFLHDPAWPDRGAREDPVHRL